MRGDDTTSLLNNPECVESLQFETSLLQQGAPGGRLAAKLLLSSLPSIIQSTVPHLVKTKGQMASLTGNVVINVVVNRFGLAGALFKVSRGCVSLGPRGRKG